MSNFPLECPKTRAFSSYSVVRFHVHSRTCHTSFERSGKAPAVYGKFHGNVIQNKPIRMHVLYGFGCKQRHSYRATWYETLPVIRQACPVLSLPVSLSIRFDSRCRTTASNFCKFSPLLRMDDKAKPKKRAEEIAKSLNSIDTANLSGIGDLESVVNEFLLAADDHSDSDDELDCDVDQGGGLLFSDTDMSMDDSPVLDTHIGLERETPDGFYASRDIGWDIAAKFRYVQLPLID